MKTTGSILLVNLKNLQNYPSENSQLAIVTQDIQPNCVGQIRYRASWWQARSSQNVTLYAGDIVKIIGVANPVLLLVEPANQDEIAELWYPPQGVTRSLKASGDEPQKKRA